MDGCTDTFAEQRYRENEVFEISAFRSKVGLKKFKKDLQLSDECSMILYVVLKVQREEAVIVHRIVNDGSFFVKHSKKVLTLKLTLMI